MRKKPTTFFAGDPAEEVPARTAGLQSENRGLARKVLTVLSTRAGMSHCNN